MADAIGDGRKVAAILANVIIERSAAALVRGAGLADLTNGIKRSSQVAVDFVSRVSDPARNEGQVQRALLTAAHGHVDLANTLTRGLKDVGACGVIIIDANVGEAETIRLQFEDGRRFPIQFSDEIQGHTLDQCLIGLIVGRLSSEAVKRLKTSIASRSQPCLVLCTHLDEDFSISNEADSSGQSYSHLFRRV